MAAEVPLIASVGYRRRVENIMAWVSVPAGLYQHSRIDSQETVIVIHRARPQHPNIPHPVPVFSLVFPKMAGRDEAGRGAMGHGAGDLERHGTMVPFQVRGRGYVLMKLSERHRGEVGPRVAGWKTVVSRKRGKTGSGWRVFVPGGLLKDLQWHRTMLKWSQKGRDERERCG